MNANILTIVNQKGGTGKTTTAINLGAGLQKQGQRVLLVDMDPQSNLSYALGITEPEWTVKDVLSEEVSLLSVLVEAEDMDILPASTDLADYELSAFRINPSSYLLKKVLDGAREQYDYMIIDCAPSLSWLTINALSVADALIVPLQLDVFSIQGLSQIINTVGHIKEQYNQNLMILGVLPVMVDSRKKLTQEVLEHIEKHVDVEIFTSRIRIDVKAAEAPSFGLSLLEYAPNSRSSLDYITFAKEINMIYEKNINSKRSN